MLGLVQQVKAYERLTIAAATSGDRSLALRALLANPLVPDYPTAAGLLDEILVGQPRPPPALLVMDPRAARMPAAVVVDGATKGFPPVGEPVPLLEVGARGWTLLDLQPPVLVLRRTALEHNLALMAGFCRERGVEIAPHGKTTMAPQLWHLQLDAGAWGITAATAVQARAMRAAGVRRILIANELTDPGSIRWAATDLREEGADLVCYVDGLRGVELLEDGLRETSPPRPLPVLVELGHAGGRTGCRDPEQAVEVARAVGRSPHLSLAGVAGYEGTIAHDRAPDHLAPGACLPRRPARAGRAAHRGGGARRPGPS